MQSQIQSQIQIRTNRKILDLNHGLIVNVSSHSRFLKVAVLLSGGVDSSVALHLLQEQGHDLKAYYLKISLLDELEDLGSCPWKEDIQYAERTCQFLDIPLEILSFQQEYQERILSYVVSEVKKGYTPNPDMLCNNRIKFGSFMDRVGQEFEKIATGHYARIIHQRERYELRSSPDMLKDQTYFLARLSQEKLKMALFPLGEYTKKEVREIAEKRGLPASKRKDSQGLCFLGKIRYSEFLRSFLKEKEGDLLEYESGKILGKHPGFWFYTIGQRHGLRLSGGPWNVIDCDPKENRIYISKNYYSPEKKRNRFHIRDLMWFSDSPPEGSDSLSLRVKIRHGELSYPCNIQRLKTQKKDWYQDMAKTQIKEPIENQIKDQIKDQGDSKFKDEIFLVKIEGRDQGTAPGQFAVFYHQDLCIGSGIISNQCLEAAIPSPSSFQQK